MDYNDNEYEVHNLHLAGEEISKISSVLRPLALPKFDFDDSLHGHLRFDSLVENEVFLSIPSHEDNQWIGDFSQGSSGIGFSSSATESCALPRRNNVWSEATSSESVELLLKAVVQEEMFPGETVFKESDPGDQLGSSAKQMDTNLRQDGEINDTDDGNPSLPHTEFPRYFSRSNQSVGVEGVNAECILHVQEAKFSSNGVCADREENNIIATTEKFYINLKNISDNQGETPAPVNEFKIDQMQENFPVSGMEIDNTKHSSEKVTVSVGEPDNQDKISDISFASMNCVSKGISEVVEVQKEECHRNDQRLGGSAAGTVHLEMHSPSGIPSKKESMENHAVKICISNFGVSSSFPRKGEPVSTVRRCNEDPFVVEPGGCIECGTVVFFTGSEINPLPEDCNKSCDESPVSLQGEECVKEFEIQGGDVDTPKICANTDLKKVSVIQPSDGHKSPVGNQDVCSGSNSFLEVSRATFESSMLPEVLGNSSEKDGESLSNLADGLGEMSNSSFAGEWSEEKSVIEEIREVGDACVMQKENLEDADCVCPPLLAGCTVIGRGQIPSRQVDIHEYDQDVSAFESGDKTLPFDLSNMVCHGNEKVTRSTFSGKEVKVNVKTTTESQSNCFVENYPALNTEVEDAKLVSCGKSDELSTIREHNLTSCGMGSVHGDQRKETEIEAAKETNTSIPKVPLEVADKLASAFEAEICTLPAFSAVGTRTVDQSVSLVGTSSSAIHNEVSMELNEMMKEHPNEKMEDNPACDLIVQDNGVEAAPTEELMEAGIEINRGMNSSIVSVTSCSVEIDESNHLSATGVSCTELSRSRIKKQESLERNAAEYVGKVLSATMNSEMNDVSKEEETFTFDIRPLGGQSTGDFGKGLLSFPFIQASKLSLTGKVSPLTSGSIQIDSMIVKEFSPQSSSMPDGVAPSGCRKPPSERKTRRGSSKSGKESAKRGNQVKETTPLRQGVKSRASLSSLGTGQLMTLESFVKSNSRAAVSTPTSHLPILNTSTPTSAFFQQPFTDLQQVQLRAQIFVYGSLIQGAAPDEACMVSAFDGGMSIWEPSWRAFAEKLHGQKSQGSNTKTPVQSRSGAKALDQASNQCFPKSEVFPSPAGRASNKNLVGRTTSWPSQAPFPVPWLATSQSSLFDISANYSTFPNTEPMKLTPLKESSMAIPSGTKHASPFPATHTGATNVFGGISSLVDLKKVTVSGCQTSADTKTRKRKKSSGCKDVVQNFVAAFLAESVFAPTVANDLSKKAPVVEDLNQISLIARNQAELMSTPAVSSHCSSLVAVSAPSGFVSKGTSNKFFTTASPSVSSDHLKIGDFSMEKRAPILQNFSQVEEAKSSTEKRLINLQDFSKVEDAKLQAEEASAHAAAAISECQGVWSQLNQQKKSGLMSDAVAKLAYATVAIAAAAAVAKAAAAAAKIASSAAVQAKQMSDETVTQYGTANTTDYHSNFLSHSVNNLANGIPVSILKGGNRNNAASLAIFAAREAARKRVEAALAATKHAENLDAIVKAAELAAEAVSHAGTIVSMGDPFPMSELVEAGPNNYWKVSQAASLPGSKLNDINNKISNKSNVGVVLNEGPAKEIHMTNQFISPVPRELSRNMINDHLTVEESLISSGKHVERNYKLQKDITVPDSAKPISIVSEPSIESRSNFVVLDTCESTSSLKEGSLVEVLKDRGDLKEAWFSANVLSLKDGEALVLYTKLHSNAGPEQLKEWVSLEAVDDKAPIIRIPHPMTAMQFEGTRKRRRATIRDYAWSVGDKVDVWVQDCWCEGMIAETNKKNTTALSVHFPAQGDTLIVKAWHLRPTVTWSEGQWIEWRRPGLDESSKGDTPVEKQAKLGNLVIETKGQGQMAKGADFLKTRINDGPRLPLSANEKSFNIDNTRGDDKPNMVRTMRPGLQKEGSRVVFGVPKPGKKRKFMEVSKHYVSDRSTKTNVSSDSVNLAKKFIPQGSGSRGWKNHLNCGLKEKQAAESKPKALRTGKLPSIPFRTLLQKNCSTSPSDVSLLNRIVKGSISNSENGSGGQILTSFGSFEVTSGGSMVFSSEALPQEICKKKSTRITKLELLNKGKLGPAGGKSAKYEENETLASEVVEPRRSSRRIQPTSRLLEGLQSSLTISKMGSSHDKSHGT